MRGAGSEAAIPGIMTVPPAPRQPEGYWRLRGGREAACPPPPDDRLEVPPEGREYEPPLPRDSPPPADGRVREAAPSDRGRELSEDSPPPRG